jgi:hypothetical protein
MPPNDSHSMVHRAVEGRGGSIELRIEVIVRQGYGAKAQGGLLRNGPLDDWRHLGDPH